MEDKINELKTWLENNGLRLEVGKHYGGLYVCHESGAYALLDSDRTGIVSLENPKTFDTVFMNN